MRAITLTCEHLSLTLAPSEGRLFVPSLRIEHDASGWTELARDISIHTAPAHSSDQWSIADRSPSSARLVRTSTPIGVVARCEVLPGRVELGIEFVNTTCDSVELDVSVSCRIARSLTKHAEDPTTEISGSVASIDWSPSAVRLTASSAGVFDRVSCDHGSTDAPWFTLSASAETQTLAARRTASGVLSLALARGG